MLDHFPQHLVPVTDYAAALSWYEQFFGGRPSFLPNDTEAVWEVAEHRYIYIVQEPERAGNALVLSFVDDLDDRVDVGGLAAHQEVGVDVGPADDPPKTRPGKPEPST